MSLYVWGSNKSKQLNNQKVLHCYSPVYTPGACGDNVPTAIATGDSHSLVLCESGDIYSFGRGKDGQLGHGDGDSSESNRVSGLEDETVISIAAGSASSYAITSTGNVYQWGLIYKSVSQYGDQNGAETGQLHGLAQDQDNFVVEADLDARQEEAATQAVAASHPALPAENRQLRDLVRDSTEQWQLPSIEADLEYQQVLQERGFQPEEIKQRMVERGREYLQMLTRGCMRYPLGTPRLIPNLRHIRVKAVATGYAHTMLLTDVGRLYSAGYNDRGQLGLGHRINTSEFKLIDYISNKFVLQVTCGQQHTVCRAVERDGPAVNDETQHPLAGSEAGADVYVWGNGTLGQLGLGKLGTTKGRLFPTRNEFLHQDFPLGVVCVSAGANFTAIVTSSGGVYSFGHSEYNQHGDRIGAHQDYVEAHYYFVPRRVAIARGKGGTSYHRTAGRWSSAGPTEEQEVHIRRLSCGACFTLAVDIMGDLYSWGWNESGVLGHGVRHFASSPLRIASIGANFDGCKVRTVSAGGNHVAALTDSQGHAWASSFHSILESDKYTDCTISIDDRVSAVAAKYAPSGKKAAGGSRQATFPCHRAVLSARSTFLRGFVQAAMREMGEIQAEEAGGTHLVITLPSAHANAVTVKSLLDYLYMDRIHIVSHKRQELALLAADLHLERLVAILSADADTAPHLTHSVASSFTQNMVNLFHSPMHSDIVFVVRKAGAHKEWSNGEDAEVRDFVPEEHAFVLYGHRVVVCSRLPYFEALLSGGFSESQNTVLVRAPFGGPVCKAVEVDVSGLVLEGIELPTFEMVLLYAYTGQLHSNSSEEGATAAAQEDGEGGAVDLNEVMSVLVAANRLGFTSLMQHCERLLSLHLGHYFPHNAQNCLEFATAYNIPRLEKQCKEILGKSTASAAAPGQRGGSGGGAKVQPEETDEANWKVRAD